MLRTNQIGRLDTIEQYLKQIIESEEYQQLKEGDYQPDLSLEDAITAVSYLLDYLSTQSKESK